MTKKLLHSFKPIADSRSCVLILGTMPGPEALRKREYYGFNGNHFWPIMADLFKSQLFSRYSEKIRLMTSNRVALWDVIESCTRKGASDGAIRSVRANDVATLLKKRPRIRAVFLNGGTAARLYRRHFPAIGLPCFVMPSTSPANARIPYAEKLRRWSAIKRWVMTKPETRCQ